VCVFCLSCKKKKKLFCVCCGLNLLLLLLLLLLLFWCCVSVEVLHVAAIFCCRCRCLRKIFSEDVFSMHGMNSQAHRAVDIPRGSVDMYTEI